MFDFHGKTAMVTGAGKNIGKAVAMQFAQAGANIVLCDYSAYHNRCFGCSVISRF